MDMLRQILKRCTLLTGMALLTLPSSGCLLAAGFFDQIVNFSQFWTVSPPIPVMPYWSQRVEDKMWEEERYDRVPVLDPVEGENAPLFCLDTPSPDEVMRALPDDTAGGIPFFTETARNNVRITFEPIVDKLEECRFYPLVGPARLHKCHYKCTVYFEKVMRSDYPIPFTHRDDTSEVVYIDHDHLIRCAGPAANGE